MLIGLNEIRGYKIQASDGSIGKTGDFFFDDHRWTVRYLVVDTGWLFGRDVLVAPDAVESVDTANSAVAISLTKREIEDGPGVATDLPVSRQEEIVLREHYGWPHYWSSYPAGVPAAPLIPVVIDGRAGEALADSSTAADVRERSDPHLRSVREVEGYEIKATDGEIGKVSDLIVDSDSWSLRYIVVDTRKWLPGRKVLLAPSWAKGIDWAQRLVAVEMDRESVKSSPRYDTDKQTVPRAYEADLHEHYRREPYWM